MLHVIGTLARPGREMRYQGHSTLKVLDGLRAAFETRTRSTLRLLYDVVADALAAQFTELREKAHAQVEVLAKLAELEDASVPAHVETEIRDVAARVAWRPVARASVLELLDAAKALARPLDQAQPQTRDDWIKACFEVLDRDAFAEDTGLRGKEIDLAVDRTAKAMLAWPELADHMPIAFRGSLLTVGATANGVVLAEGAPMLLVPEPGVNAPAPIFKTFQPDDGIAVLADDPAVTVVNGSSEGELAPSLADDAPVVVYEFTDGMVPLALHASKEATAVRAGEQIELDGRFSWDPEAVGVQEIGPALLFKAKVRDHGFEFAGEEGFRRLVEVTKEPAPNAEGAILVIE
jgi:hypothetical protein